MQPGMTIVALAAICLLSLVRRALIIEARREIFRKQQVPVEPRPSPISEAILQFAGTAGGIYIALAAVRSFLGLDIPERVALFGLKVEPLAALSFVLAAIGPYLVPMPQAPEAEPSAKNTL